jgi:hypothetical protein
MTKYLVVELKRQWSIYKAGSKAVFVSFSPGFLRFSCLDCSEVSRILNINFITQIMLLPERLARARGWEAHNLQVLSRSSAQMAQRPSGIRKNPRWLCGQDTQTHRTTMLRMPVKLPAIGASCQCL